MIDTPMVRTWRTPVVVLLACSIGGCAVQREPGGVQTVPQRAAEAVSRGGLDAESSAQLDSLVRDVCGKTVVMLGEDAHHGGGHTLEIKAELVQRLLERCGFNAVYFESGVYEFADLNRRLAAGTSAPEQVADAIGGFWNTNRAIDPLVDYLYTQASTRKIRLGGLDSQLGGASAGYERAALVDDLVLALHEPRRSTCAAELTRNVHRRYDDEHPFDDAARARVAACFREAADAAPPDSVPSVLAQAALSMLPPGAPASQERESGLGRMFRWNQRQASGPFRAIVWTANVHAGRSSPTAGSTWRTFGNDLQAEYGDRLASIAFTSLGGAYGFSQATAIPEAGSESLEARTMAGEAKTLRYLPKALLAELGAVDSSLLSHGNTRHADWSSLFDGLVILREEKPQSIDRPPKPRFVPPERRDPPTSGARGNASSAEQVAGIGPNGYER